MEKKSVLAKGKKFVQFISKEKIEEINNELAERINKDYASKSVLFIVVMKGAMFFASDLLRKINIDCQIDYISAKSYLNQMTTTGKVEITKPKASLENRDVIIIEDLIDSGTTMNKLLPEMQKLNPASLEVVTFLTKPENMKYSLPLKYVGIEVPNLFVIGYGFDYAEIGRNLPDIYILSDQ
ncbi:MAG TPA: hypoxanthine phosphoribosyltransferase [Candidatus Kapabacteria bacterium]|nr:hypoxanthine phosphoribosyltransferase [Candidatus Kapabacteria bacterium]HPO61711.1 hypoxanthine phosphoribosyltransferase [Candidatus Kapabacteria bacterium]